MKSKRNQAARQTVKQYGIGERVELHSVTPGVNPKPELRIFDPDTDELLATVRLPDFLACARWFYEGYLKHELGLDPTSKEFNSLLKVGLKRPCGSPV